MVANWTFSSREERGWAGPEREELERHLVVGWGLCRDCVRVRAPPRERPRGACLGCKIAGHARKPQQPRSIWLVSVMMSPSRKPSSPSFSGSKSYRALQLGWSRGAGGGRRVRASTCPAAGGALAAPQPCSPLPPRRAAPSAMLPRVVSKRRQVTRGMWSPKRS